jgi:PHP family Zn ribbon phosphoesterase
MGTICPVCGRQLTVGVMSRVESLATADIETNSRSDKFGVRWIGDKDEKRPPYVMMVPLIEILAEALESGVGSQKVLAMFMQSAADRSSGGEKVAQGISLVRKGDIVIEPGYDGVFGKVGIWKEDKKESVDDSSDQGMLF